MEKANITIEKVIQRLKTYGYNFGNGVTDNYTSIIQVFIDKVNNYVLQQCNLVVIPINLESIVIDRVSGEFLNFKRISSENNGIYELEPVVKSIQEGDVSITYSEGNDKQKKVESFINSLIHTGDGEFVCYRKLNWQ